MCYAHFPPQIRANAPASAKFLKPNSMDIFNGFSKNQVARPSGGPKESEMRFSFDEIRTGFIGLNFDYLEEKIVDLKNVE